MAETPAPTGVAEARRWRFGDVVFDGDELKLYVHGREVALELKPLEALRHLLQRPNKAAARTTWSPKSSPMAVFTPTVR